MSASCATRFLPLLHASDILQVVGEYPKAGVDYTKEENAPRILDSVMKVLGRTVLYHGNGTDITRDRIFIADILAKVKTMISNLI